MIPRREAVLAFAGGLVFASSTPPTDFQPGILVGLVGLAYAFGLDPRRGASVGFAFGVGANLVALRFVPGVMARFTDLPAPAGWLALFLLSLMQSLPWLAGGAAYRVLARHVPAWLAFGLAVYAALLCPAVFPWTPAGGLARWPILIQTAEVVGERGASFLVATACALAAVRAFPASAALFAVLLGYGAVRMHAVDAARAAAPKAKIALLQPDFDALFRWDDRHSAILLDGLLGLTKHAEDAGAVLTVWPESAYPYTLAHGIAHEPRGVRAVHQAGVRGPVLTGAYLTKGHGVGTNATLLFAADGTVGPSYDKRHLLWFGETIPLGDVFPVLRRIFARGTGIDPGTEEIAFTSGPIRAAVLNCYEDTLSVAGREAMSVRPNLLVNVTNDAWFAGSVEGDLHLRLAVPRAIETRRDLVRAVNRGPTTWVDANGRVLARRDPAPPGVPPPLLVDAPLLDGPPTAYARFGELPLLVLVLAALAHKVKRALLSTRREAPAQHTGT